MTLGGGEYPLRLKRVICLILVLLLFMTGCGESSSPSESSQSSAPAQEASEEQDDEITENPVPSSDTSQKENFVPYVAPAFEEAVFNESAAEGESGVLFDLSGLSDGYVGVSGKSDSRLKFQVLKEDITYTYDVKSDGTPSIFPLQSGNGSYKFRMMENISESKYAELYSTTADVTITNEFAPFVRPSDYVNYNKDSGCVKKAQELAEEASDAVGVVSKIYEYVTSNVVYDYDKAATVQSGYLPTPDETMTTGKGICFDYASLAASMLRSQGIPTKLIFGYVAPDDLYHAWNMFYTEETGWVTVNFEVKEDEWTRLDLTFAANGSDAKFIGDGSNYSDLYYF